MSKRLLAVLAPENYARRIPRRVVRCADGHVLGAVVGYTPAGKRGVA